MIKTIRRRQTQFGASPCCGGTATIDAEYADGKQTHPMGWEIADGEVVRFNYIRCGKCGGEQWS